jgi:hypothetical protein
LCEISNPLKKYKEIFSKQVFQSFVLMIQGFILTSTAISCASVSKKFVYSKSQQTLNFFFNSAKFDLYSLVLKRLISCLDYIAYIYRKQDAYMFFIVDDFVFSKRKYKKTEGVGINYCGSTKKAFRSQCVVSSSCLIGDYHFIFKSLFYIGKKYICSKRFQTKTQLAISLFSRFEKFIKKYKSTAQTCIALLDGGYTNSHTITAIKNSSVFKGFIGKFHYGRNMFINNTTIKLKDYLGQLTLKDFIKLEINGTQKYVHEVLCTICKTSPVKMILVIDDVQHPEILSVRPLITNILELSATEIIGFYAKRWKEETYHQILKDAFFARTHKLRSLKALSRFMECIAVAYDVCEKRKFQKNQIGIFDVKNSLISITNSNYILNIKGNKIKKLNWHMHIFKFAA